MSPANTPNNQQPTLGAGTSIGISDGSDGAVAVGNGSGGGRRRRNRNSRRFRGRGSVGDTGDTITAEATFSPAIYPHLFSSAEVPEYDDSHNVSDNNEEDSPADESTDEDDEDNETSDRRINPFAVLDTSEADDDLNDDEQDEDHSFVEEGDDDDVEVVVGDQRNAHNSDEEEEISYYDSDGDDSEEVFRLPPPEFMEYMMRNYLIDSEYDENDYDDDEYDDEGVPCDCRTCMCRRFGLSFCVDDDEDEDGDYDERTFQVPNLESPRNNERGKKRYRKRHKNRQNNKGAPCAICLEDEAHDRRFAFLPCCGSNTTEQTSSLRFCLKCLMKNTVKNGEIIPGGGTDPPLTDQQMRVVSECPRCKKLLCLTATNKHGNKNTGHRSKKKSSKFNHKIEPATIQEIMWYVGKQPNPYYIQVMLSIAYGLPHKVMYPLIKTMPSDPEKIMRNLHQWGLISKRPTRSFSGKTSGSAYTIDYSSQLELRKGLIRHLKLSKDAENDYLEQTIVDDDGENIQKQCLSAALFFYSIGLFEMKKWNLKLFIRTWNRSLTLALLGTGLMFPPINLWPAKYVKESWHIMTAFNVFLLYMICKVLVQLVWVVFYLLQAFLVSQAVSALFHQPSNLWIRRSQNAILICFVGYASYSSSQYFFRFKKTIELCWYSVELSTKLTGANTVVEEQIFDVDNGNDL